MRLSSASTPHVPRQEGGLWCRTHPSGSNSPVCTNLHANILSLDSTCIVTSIKYCMVFFLGMGLFFPKCFSRSRKSPLPPLEDSLSYVHIYFPSLCAFGGGRGKDFSPHLEW